MRKQAKKQKYVTNGKCVCCAYVGEIDLHHIRSRGAGGTDDSWNLLPVCRFCHRHLHDKGLLSFSRDKRYYKLAEWLDENGWIFDAFANKYINEAQCL